MDYSAAPSAAVHPRFAMARRAPLLLLAAGLAALLLFVLADRKIDGRPDGLVRSGPGDVSTVDGAADLARVDGDPAAARSDAPVAEDEVAAAGSDGSEAAPERADDATARPVEGRLVVLDPGLGPRFEESGEIVAYPWPVDEASEDLRLEVERGRFDRAALVRDAYRIRTATMDTARGPRDVLFDDLVFDVDPDEDLLLQGRYVPVRTLRALDASTGRDLDLVSVLALHPEQEPEDSAASPHSFYPSQFVLRERTSPLTLPVARGVERYWITAEGYGWARTTVDHEREGESVVRLVAGGSLRVEVIGLSDGVHGGGSCTISVIDAEGNTFSAQGLDARREGSTTHHFRGVPLGPTEVRVAAGAPGSRTEVLASASVVVRADAPATARISLSPDHFRRPVPARVEIHGEPDRLRAVTGLSHRPADGVSRHGQDARDMTWESLNLIGQSGPLTTRLERLTPGTYRFVIAPSMQVEDVDVLERLDADAHIDGPERKLQTIRLQLEAARDLTVRVVDARSGAPVEGATVTWAPVLDPPLTPPVTDEAELAEGAKTLLLPLADGEYVLTARAPLHAPGSTSVRFASGGQEVRLELEPREPREVVLLVDGRQRAWPEGAWCSIRRRGEDREDAVTYRPEDGALFAYAPRPGIYDLEIQGLGPSRFGERALRLAVEVGEDDPMRIVLAR